MKATNRTINTGLLSTMAKQGIKKLVAANAIGITAESLANKLKGRTRFVDDEIAGLQRLLNLTDTETVDIFIRRTWEK